MISGARARDVYFASSWRLVFFFWGGRGSVV